VFEGHHMSHLEIRRFGIMEHLIPANWRRTIEHLRDEIHHTLDRWLHRQQQQHPDETAVQPWTPSSTGGPMMDFPASMIMGSPMLDVEETADNVVVTAELPGLEKEDFTVEMSGEWLRIRGEKKQQSEQRGRDYYYAERRYGAFSRAVALPCEVDADQANADYKNGVLWITLPKTAGAKARRINVEVKS
jgi:HSP20 family protein